MNDLLAALLLGIIEGITEFLPISSTGHLLIAERWLGHRSDLFNIAIQAGAILAVVLIYRERLLALLLGLGKPANRDYVLKLGASFGATAVLGLLVKKLGFELPDTLGPIAWALIIGGFIMLGAEQLAARRAQWQGEQSRITWTVAVLVGVAQVIAGVFPGTSRSAAAIFAAMLFGTGNRVAATEFAFLVGIPTMFAATAYELLHLLTLQGVAGENWTLLAVAFVTAAITAFVAVKWLLSYIQTHRFTVFSWYRIVLGAALLLWLPPGGAGSNPGPATVPGPAFETHEGGPMPPPENDDRMRPDSDRMDESASASATKPAIDRQFELLKFCAEAASASRQLQDPGMARALTSLAPEMMSADPVERRQRVDMVAATLDRLDRAKVECAGLEKTAIDGSIYALALRAADRGNRLAAICYVITKFPMSSQMWASESARAIYYANARRLVDAGVRAGDWGMVSVAQLIYDPARMLWRHPPVGNQSAGPALSWLPGILPRGDRQHLYALFRLRQLGAPPGRAGSDYAALAEFNGRDLTPTQRWEDERWAADIFQQGFAGKALPSEDSIHLC